MPSKDKFVLYWLDESRAHRILWLLELLELDYDVQIYLRHPETWRAPPELLLVHPLGKAPILEIHFSDGSPPLQLAELGLIIQYLLSHYDTRRRFSPKGERDQLLMQYYLHYAEGTLEAILMPMLINTSAKRVAPLGLRSLAKVYARGMNNGYYIHEYHLNLQYLEEQLRAQGTGFFVGGKLTGADIILSFPIYENLFDNEAGVKECADETDLYKKYPNLGAWCDRVRRDPAYSRISQLMREKVDELYAMKKKSRK